MWKTPVSFQCGHDRELVVVKGATSPNPITAQCGDCGFTFEVPWVEPDSVVSAEGGGHEGRWPRGAGVVNAVRMLDDALDEVTRDLIAEELATYPYEGSLSDQRCGGAASRKRTRDRDVSHEWEPTLLDKLAGMIPEPGTYFAEWWYAKTPVGAWLDWHAHGGAFAGTYVAQNGGIGAYFETLEDEVETPEGSCVLWPSEMRHGIPRVHAPVTRERLVVAANFFLYDGSGLAVGDRVSFVVEA